MSSGRKSRFAQILKNHHLFKLKEEEKQKHYITKAISKANDNIKDYFEKEKIGEDKAGKEIIDSINTSLEEFTGIADFDNAFVDLTGKTLDEMIYKLSLNADEFKPSLGMQNLLYIAAEFLLLQQNRNGLRLVLIEELEAHLHPHFQLNLLKYLEKEINNVGQTILTTHSVILGSSITLKNLIICKNGNVFPMGDKFTKLEPKNYNFLERFLDATKANLFFAKGVILVEGDAENLLVPAIAEVIDLPLHKKGVSIVNLGTNTTFAHYAKIFLRNEPPSMGIPVSIITDMDVTTEEYLKENLPKVYSIKQEQIPEISITETIIETAKDRFESEILKQDSGADRDIIKSIEKYALPGELIQHYQEMKRKRKQRSLQEISVCPLQTFTNEWTLEYEIAKSCLKEELLEVLQQIKEDGQSMDITDDTSDPYKLFKPFLSYSIKSIAALYLAKRIVEKKNELRDDILEDTNLKYIISAIKYACGKMPCEQQEEETSE